MKTVQDGKWWKFFINFCTESKLADGSEEEFIKQLFESWDEKGKLYPYVLSQEIAGMIEKRMLSAQEHEEKILTDDDYIKITLRKAMVWAKENHITNNKIGAFLISPVCIMRALRGDYYKPLFMFSEPFLKKYGDLSEEDVLKKSSIRAFHPEIYNILKQALNINFVD